MTLASLPDDTIGPVALFFDGRAEGREHITWMTATLHGPLGMIFSALVAGREDILPSELLSACPLKLRPISELPPTDPPFDARRELHARVAFLLARSPEPDWLEVAGWPKNVVLQPGGLRDSWQRQRFAWAGVPDDIRRRIRINLGLVATIDKVKMEKLRRRALQAANTLSRRHPDWQNDPQSIAMRNLDLLARVQLAHRYLARCTKDAFYWYPQDLVAAAWIEVVHAKQTGGAAAPCSRCGMYFLVPHGYRTGRCPCCPPRARLEAR